jgi:hypothetical protein
MHFTMSTVRQGGGAVRPAGEAAPLLGLKRLARRRSPGSQPSLSLSLSLASRPPPAATPTHSGVTP